jgi:hypothetical protein
MKAQAVASVAGAGVLFAAGAHAEVAFKVSLSWAGGEERGS